MPTPTVTELTTDFSSEQFIMLYMVSLYHCVIMLGKMAAMVTHKGFPLWLHFWKCNVYSVCMNKGNAIDVVYFVY